MRAVDELEACSDRPERMNAYQKLIAAAANHMTILAPFLPALAALL